MNNATIFLDKFQFSKWYKLKNEDPIRMLYHKFGFNFIDIFVNIWKLTSVGCIFMAIIGCAVNNINNENYFFIYIAGALGIFSLISFLFAPITYFVDNMRIKLLERTVTAYFNKYGLKPFIHSFINDKYSPDAMKKEQFYHPLILSHYNKNDYISRVFDVLHTYNQYACDSIHHDKEQFTISQIFKKEECATFYEQIM